MSSPLPKLFFERTTTYQGVLKSLSYTQDQTKTFVNSKNWRDLVAKHIDAGKGYTRWGAESNPAPCKVTMLIQNYMDYPTTVPNGPPVYGVAKWTPMWPYWPGIDTVTRDRALKKLKRKLATWQPNADVLVPLGELRELRSNLSGLANVTSNMLEILIELQQAAISAKRLNARAAKKSLKSIAARASDVWLNYSFNVAPTIDDVQSISQSIAAYNERSDQTYIVDGTATNSYIKVGEISNVEVSRYGWVYIRSREEWEDSYRFKAVVFSPMKSANDYGLLQHLGMSSERMIPAAWELMPLSFVADYFSTAGDYFSDVFESRRDLLKTVYVCENRKTVVRVTPEVYGPRFNNTRSVILEWHVPSFPTNRFFRFDRTMLTSIPSRTLRFKTMDEIGANSVNRVLNLASMLGSGLAKRGITV